MSKKRNSFELIVPHMNKKIERLKLVPPDGGWGWMVLLGTALSNIFNQSMLSLFSLLYGDELEAMGYNTQGAAIVNSTMLFVSNLGGLIAGAIVKLTSPRFVSVTGAVSCTSGILLSGFSSNIWHFILTYGVLLGLGLGFIQNASFVAINSYFKVRKSLAVGLSVVGTGVGQTLMPHVVQYLLDNFGFKGACLLLASLSAHGICGTLLMQPVEWHMKQVEVEINENMYLLEENNKVNEYNVTIKGKGLATEPTLISESAAEKENSDKVLSQSYKELQINKNEKSAEILNGNYGNDDKPKKTLSRKIYDLFDISLLSNPRFLNVIIGIAILSVSVLNFSMLFPLFLQKKVFMDKKHTALCMSAVSLADIVGRLTLPALQDKYHIKARIMMIMTCVWLIVVRQILAYQTNLYVLLTISALYGVGKSMVIVAKNIAISEECRMDQVPSAIGLGMLGTGVIVPPAGYFLGWIRDYTDSYIVCITAQNLLLVVFLVMWIPDMILIYNKKGKENRKNIEQAISLQ